MSTPSLSRQKAIVAKLGMDAHWRGAIVVANGLREAGMEVVYLGHASPDDLVVAVLQEDPVLLGLSTLSGNHLSECPLMLDALRSAGIDDIVVAVGGAIPAQDEVLLREAGVDAVFGTGTPLPAMLADLDVLVACRLEQRRDARNAPADWVVID